MTVKDLKKILAEQDDNMTITIGYEFWDGNFFHEKEIWEEEAIITYKTRDGEFCISAYDKK